MASCCPHPTSSQSTGSFFSKRAARYARSFKRGKLEPIQQFIIDIVSKDALEGKHLLDIGSGVGKLHLSLLRSGASSATAIDMSEEMLEHAKRFAHNYGIEDKISYRLGDFLSMADSIPDSDITMLDKVICCYEDLPGLLSASAGKTRSTLALTFPADNFMMRTIFTLQIAAAVVFRAGFRPYWHDWTVIPTILSQHGFQRIESTSRYNWQGAVYKRTDR
jgi:magnesium-protoporphyrin O-methyltransferase